MIILLDVGNTRIKWALVDQGSLHVQPPFAHADLLPHELYQGLRAHCASVHQKPEAIWIANVAGPQLGHILEEWAQKTFHLEPHWIRSTALFRSIQNAYPEPHLLGVDRLLGMLGARHQLVNDPLFVVNCGTAVTLDAIDQHNRHLGGLIVPGLRIMRKGVKELIYDFKEPQEPSAFPPPTLLANNTYHGIWGGTALSLISVIEKVQLELMHHLGPHLKSVISGGDSDMLLPLLTTHGNPWQHKPHLVLEGMWRYTQGI